MADRNNPFGGYDEKNVGRTVQNVTSSMWEPISTGGPSPKKNTPVRKNDERSRGPVGDSARTASAGKKTQTRKTAGADVTRDRISEGGRKTPKADGKKLSSPKAEKSKKKKAPPKEKRPVGSKSRQPKGRDTRNTNLKEEQARIQREKKRAREQAKSRERVKQQSRQGVSYDEMRSKKSRKTRRRAKIIAVATVVAALIAVFSFVGIYVYQQGAVVAVISIEGESRYKDKKITEAANVYVGINMLSVRERTVNESVTKALPYIKEVQVDYQFPDTLVLKVTPTEEKLLLENGTGYICLDADGKVLSLKKKKLTDGRYLIEGFEEQKAVAGESFVPSENNKDRYEKVKEIVAVLGQNGKFTKGTINVADLRDVSAVYDSRINIYLGDCARLESQLGDAVNVIEKDEDIINGQTGYIETRYEGQTVFKPGSMKK
ncbi:MAG: FtsQ-type POTRA domain-containing protein [Clostridia bacterium]|nr:FtsQ-type POTRA domain-containing protein [Clostridia bacterium]